MTKQEIEHWLRAKIAARLRTTPQSIDVHRPLDAFGIASMEAIQIAGELESLLERPVEATLFWDYRTIAALAAAVAGEAGGEVLDATPSTAMTANMSDEQVDALLRKLRETG